MILAAATVTVSAKVALTVVTPVPVAVDVSVYEPGAVAAPTVIATVCTSPAAVTAVVTPAGAPVTATVTGPVKLVRVMVAANDPVPPCTTDALAGAVAMAMAGRAVTVIETIAVR